MIQNEFEHSEDASVSEDSAQGSEGGPESGGGEGVDTGLRGQVLLP